MTQAMNLANFSNSLDSAGGVPPTQLNSVVPLSKGGTNASTASTARISLGSGTTGDAVFVSATQGAAQTAIGVVVGTNVPSTTGTGASGTWNINVTGNAATATSANTANSATIAGSVSGIVAVANGGTGTSSGVPVNVQAFTGSGTWTKPTGGQSMAFIQVWGGGGGGPNVAGPAGGGGGYSFMHVPFSYLGSTASVTVGLGGSVDTYSTAGGDSSFPFASAYSGKNSLIAYGARANGVGGLGMILGGNGASGSTPGANSGAGGGGSQNGAAGTGVWGGNGGANNVAGSFPSGGGGYNAAGGNGYVVVTSY